MADSSSSTVFLNLYDVGTRGAVRTANNVGSKVGVGILHAGVEIHGLEFSFAYHEYGGSGIISYTPKQCAEHAFRETVPMGTSTLTRQELAQLLREMQHKWPATDYDLLRKNCCTFADELCVALGVGHIPERVNRLAGAGALLLDSFGTAQLAAVTASRALANSATDAIRVLDSRYSLHLDDGARKGVALGVRLATTGAYALGGMLTAVAGALSDRGGKVRTVAGAGGMPDAVRSSNAGESGV